MDSRRIPRARMLMSPSTFLRLVLLILLTVEIIHAEEKRETDESTCFVLFGSIAVLGNSLSPLTEDCLLEIVVQIGDKTWKQLCPAPDIDYAFNLPQGSTDAAGTQGLEPIRTGTLQVFLAERQEEEMHVILWLRRFDFSDQNVVQIDATIVVGSTPDAESDWNDEPSRRSRGPISEGEHESERQGTPSAAEVEPDGPTCWVDTRDECMPVGVGNTTSRAKEAEGWPKFVCMHDTRDAVGQHVCQPDSSSCFENFQVWVTCYLPAGGALLYFAVLYLRSQLGCLGRLSSMYDRLEAKFDADGLSSRRGQDEVDRSVRSGSWLVRRACPSPGGTLREHGSRVKRNGNVLATGACPADGAPMQADRYFVDMMDSEAPAAACFYYQCTSLPRKPPLPPGNWNRSGTGRLERHEKDVACQEASLVTEE